MLCAIQPQPYPQQPQQQQQQQQQQLQFSTATVSAPATAPMMNPLLFSSVNAANIASATQMRMASNQAAFLLGKMSASSHTRMGANYFPLSPMRSCAAPPSLRTALPFAASQSAMAMHNQSTAVAAAIHLAQCGSKRPMMPLAEQQQHMESMPTKRRRTHKKRVAFSTAPPSVMPATAHSNKSTWIHSSDLRNNKQEIIRTIKKYNKYSKTSIPAPAILQVLHDGGFCTRGLEGHLTHAVAQATKKSRRQHARRLVQVQMKCTNPEILYFVSLRSSQCHRQIAINRAMRDAQQYLFAA